MKKIPLLIALLAWVVGAAHAAEERLSCVVFGASYEAAYSNTIGVVSPAGHYLIRFLDVLGVETAIYAVPAASVADMEAQYARYQKEGNDADVVYIGLTLQAAVEPQRFLQFAQRVTAEQLDRGAVVVVASYPRANTFTLETLRAIKLPPNWDQLLDIYDSEMERVGARVIHPYQFMVPGSDGLHPDSFSARTAGLTAATAIVELLAEQRLDLR